MAMHGAARRSPATQMAISHPGVFTPDGTAFRGLPGVPMTLPREVGKLLCRDGKIIDKNVAKSNIGRTLTKKLTDTANLLANSRDRACDAANRALALQGRMPRSGADEWHAANHTKILNVTRDMDRLLSELKTTRLLWKTAAKDEILSKDIVFDLYQKASHLFVETQAASDEAAVEMRRGLLFRQEHTATWARLEEQERGKRARREGDDDDELWFGETKKGVACHPARPVCSSGSENEADGNAELAGIVHVVNKVSQRAPEFQKGAPRSRSTDDRTRVP